MAELGVWPGRWVRFPSVPRCEPTSHVLYASMRYGQGPTAQWVETPEASGSVIAQLAEQRERVPPVQVRVLFTHETCQIVSKHRKVTDGTDDPRSSHDQPEAVSVCCARP